MPIPKDIELSEKKGNSFKLSWKIDDMNMMNIDKKQIKYQVEMKKEKEKEKFIQVYEGNDNNCSIKDLEYYANYEIRICTVYNNIKSNYSQIYKIKTDFDSIILNKEERKKEYLDKIIEWCGAKSMHLLYRGTRDGMTSNNFHNKCDNKGKTLCLCLNNKGNIFGGYSSISWTSNGGNKTANDCFLFTLTNIYNTEPTKFPYENMEVFIIILQMDLFLVMDAIWVLDLIF